MGSWMRSTCLTSLVSTFWAGDGIARKLTRCGPVAQTSRSSMEMTQLQHLLHTTLMAHAQISRMVTIAAPRASCLVMLAAILLNAVKAAGGCTTSTATLAVQARGLKERT